MAAVISGNGLGLFNTSLGQTGIGLGSNARLGGQDADRQYVNVANGNLVLHSQDEQLLFRGMTLGQFRTYNSQGVSNQVGSDAWLTGFERRVELLSGTLNTAGSAMRLHTGDGAYQDFTCVSANTYRSTTGDGAHDTLTWTAASKTWTFIEGSTRREELYADHANATLKGRLTRIRDLASDGTNPAAWDVLYDGQGRITQIRTKDTTAGGTPDALVFTYDTAGRLASLSTRENGMLVGQVAYGYDSVGRLSTVLVDLTPQDGIGDRDAWDSTAAANNDGYLFRTTYTYADATSLRISEVRQSDGTLVSYGYDTEGRVVSLVRGDTNANDADGVGQTLTFTYDTANRRTDVSDSSGRTWTYAYDSAGQLTEVRAPAIDGQRDITVYTYDVDGNVTRVVNERGGVVLSHSDYEYDANGNLLWEWNAIDPAQSDRATAIQRTYTAANQVASETTYRDYDLDGVGSLHVASEGATTHYLYDAQNRVRFVVSATGEVTEMTYATSGTGVGQQDSVRRYLGHTFAGTASTSELTVWATAERRAQSSLTTYQYDLRGRLSKTTAFADVDASGAGLMTDTASVVDYVYDAQGLLRQKITARRYDDRDAVGGEVREAVVYVYDGMGRLLSEVVEERWTATGGVAQTRALSTSSWSYQDSGSTIRSIIEGGQAGDGTANDLLRTELRNAAGQLVSVTESVVTGGGPVRTTQHFYDVTGRLRASEDAGGGRTYFFYDAEGALAAQVDATGALVEYTRDAAGRVVATTAYATRIATAAWLAGGQVVPDSVASIRPQAHAEDRTSTATFDALGRKLGEIDGEGGITTYTYDGEGRLLQARSTDAAGTETTARITRYFYDQAGREIARLDAEGYLSERQYDAGGRLVRTVAYATVTTASLRADGSLEQLRPMSADADAVMRLFYDGRDNLVGKLDAEGYLTEYVYDEVRNQRAEKAWALQLTSVDPSATLQALRTGAQASTARETRRSFDGLGRVLTEVNPNGTLTRFTYDAQGRLVRTESAAGTSDIREGNRRYDAFGNLIGELSGEGATELYEGISEEELDAVYAQYGVRHEYDALGRRIESIDAHGNKTWYFYDGAGRLTHTAYGVGRETYDDYGYAYEVLNGEVEVEETRYNAFGQVRDTIAYTGKIALGEPYDREAAAAAVQVLQYVSGIDTQRQYRYDRRGLLVERTDAEGYRSAFQYDAFGGLLREEVQRNATQTVVTTHRYDRLGREKEMVEDADGITRATTATHDAFGRVVSQADGRGTVSTFEYDRLGRQVATQRTVSGRVESGHTAYDAYGRVVGLVDALGRTTSFVHDDGAMAMTMTTPEGLQVVTRYNHHGQVLEVTGQDGAVTVYTYDLDGRLTQKGVLNPGYGYSASFDDYGQANLEFESVMNYEYDERGLLIAQYDGTHGYYDDDYGWTEVTYGVVTYYYDARGRLLTRSDANGTTDYRYDGQGRQITIVDGEGVSTALSYDLEGRLTQQVVDPDGLALRTTYTWDGLGRQLTVTEGAGGTDERTIAYAYDGLGRRVSETVAVGSLDLTTTYVYDGNDNLIAAVDPEQRVTRYAYDEANRLVLSVDAGGSVIENHYDANGNKVAERRYANTVSLQGLPVATDEAALRLRLTADDARDVQQYIVYDRDGRQAFLIDGVGAVTRMWRNGAGNVVQTRRYAEAVDLSLLRTGLVAGEQAADGLAQLVEEDAVRDRVDSYLYDAAGRVRFSIDARGAVRETKYDQGGRVLASLEYTLPVDYAFYQIHDRIRQEGMDAYDFEAEKYYLEYDRAREVIFIYDQAGREVFSVTTVSERGSWGWEWPSFQVHRTVYDDVGRIARSIDYATQPDFSGEDPDFYGYTEAEMIRAMEYENSEVIRDLDDLPQRGTRHFYDAAGRQQYVVGPAGAVVQTVYDSAGQAVETRAYGEAVTMDPWDWDKESLEAALSGIFDVRVSRQEFDDAGRVVKRIDALQAFETYHYDGAGLLVGYTDKNGAVWSYGYDAAGRRTSETSPLVLVAQANADGGVSYVSRSIVTTTEYDAFGNVARRVEDAGTQSARATRYEYDNRGNQVRTIFPDAGVLDANGNLVATGIEPTIEIVYDVFGRAVMQKDVRGNYSYKAYDAAGDLRFEVDQEGYVTEFKYTLHGEQSELRRYANRIATTPGVPLGADDVQQSLVADNANDRILATVYDLVGRKTRVTQVLVEVDHHSGQSLTTFGATTEYEYNIYGDVVLERSLISDTYPVGYSEYGKPSNEYSTWREKQYWYDAAGRVTHQLDSVRNGRQSSAPGYLTTWTYNANGEKTSEAQYAREFDHTSTDDYGYSDYGYSDVTPQLPEAGDAATGFDRVTVWQYDALGRRISELSSRGDPAGGVNVQTTTDYDSAGRATAVVVDGQETRTYYDALGRVTAARESERAVVRADADTALLDAATGLTASTLYRQASPYSTMAYDAFGNVVQLRRYALGVDGAQAPVESAADVVHTMRYDRQGRSIWERDASGSVYVKTYDAADNLLSTRSRLDGNSGRWSEVVNEATYDKAGRQVTNQILRYVHQGEGGPVLQAVQDAASQVRYNAFGEIVAKDSRLDLGLATETFAAQYVYDNNGRLARSNADGGVWKAYGYDRAGQQVARWQSVRDSQGNVQEVETRMELDGRGNVTRTYLPTHDDALNATTTIDKVYDRWGNVLRVTDQRGAVTDYQYDQLNNAVRETKAEVRVLNADGTVEMMRPETVWQYDHLGRLLATRDANGNWHRNHYDDAGRLQYTEDASGNRTYNAYDAFGQKRFSQDPLGYLTFLDYDAAGRVVAQGDFLRDTAGATRLKSPRERYALNQNGNRLRVTDALGYVSSFDYDSQGRVVRSRTAAGVVMSYGYDSQGNKIRETNALSDGSLAADGQPVFRGGAVEHHIAVAGQAFSYTLPADAFGIADGEIPALSVRVEYMDPSLRAYVPATGFAFDPATRTLTGSPTQTGQYRIVYVATSSNGKTTEAWLDLSAVTQSTFDTYYAATPRAMAGLYNQYVAPGQSFSYQIPAGTVVDPQGGAISYTAYVQVLVNEYDQEEKRNTSYYDWVPLGAAPTSHWLTFDAATGTLAGTPPGVDTAEVQIVATDAEGKSVTLNLRVNSTAQGARRTVVDEEGETLNLDEQTWEYDYFGRVVDHNDLSGADYDYTYDPVTGQLVGQNSKWTEQARQYSTPVTEHWYSRDWNEYGLDSGLVGLDLPEPVLVNDPARQYSYYKSGLLKELREGNNWYRYEYDAAGNRTVEEAYTHDADGQVLHVRTRVSYDAHGRITKVTQTDVGSSRRLLELNYDYDAVGNRRRVLARSAYDPTAPDIDINGLTNPDFEHGDIGWTRGDGWTVVPGGKTGSTLNAQFNMTGESRILNQQRVQVTPGEIITAAVDVQQGASSAGEAGAAVLIQWYDAAGNVLSTSEGNMVNSASGGAWYESRVTVAVPPGAAFMSIGARAYRNGGGDPLWIDNFSWGSMPPGGTLDTGSPWQMGNGWSRSTDYGGSAKFNYTGQSKIINTTRVGVRPGSQVTARVNVQQGASSAGQAWGAVLVQFYDAAGNLISEAQGNRVDSGSGGAWHASTINVTVPPGAVTMAIGGEAGRTGGSDPLWLDDFSWNFERDGEFDSTGNYVDPDPGDAYNMAEPFKVYWYDYDAENRVKVANGRLVDGEIVLGNADVSYALDYDEAGRATRRRFLEGHTEVAEITQYDERGQRLRVFQARPLGSSEPVALKEEYVYDAVGRVLERREHFDAGTTRNDVDVSGWLKHAETFTYDADGRVMRQTIRGRALGWTATAPSDGGAWQTTQLAALSYLSAVDYSAYGYDVAGRLRGYNYHYSLHEEGSGALADDPKGYTHRYIYQYEAREGYLESRVYGSSSQANFRASTSYSSYDAWGRRTAVREQTPLSSDLGELDDRIRYFSYDGDGNILRRREGTLENGVFTQDALQQLQTQLYAYVGGSLVASGKRNGDVDVVGRLTAYQSNDSAGSQRTTVLAGETLRGIAQRVYGNANLWYVLAEANALTDDSGLTAGTTLVVPEVKVTANDAGTFKPFNPAEAVGNTAPSLPYIEPPPKEHCNALAMVIVVVVAVAAAVMTGGAILAALPSAGTLGFATAATIGAAAGAAGALAGQVAGSALGVSSFSWRNVAAGAVTGAITGGVGELLSTAGTTASAVAEGVNQTANTFSYGKTAVMALTSAGANYAGQKLAGVDVSFSWKSIAASAMASVASARVGFTPDKAPGFTRDLASGLAGGMVSAATRRVMGMGGGDLVYATVAADAFGNALGNAAVRGVQNWRANRSEPQLRHDLMEQWREEDARQLQMDIAAEEQSRLPGWASSNQTAPYDASRYTQQLDDIVLQGPSTTLTADERRRLVSTTTYHTRHVDPYAIARNGGEADQYGVTQTFWVPESAPVTTEYLPEDAVRVAAGPLSANARDAISFNQRREYYRSFYDQYRGSLLGDMAANAGTIFANGGVSIIQGLNTGWNLMTDRQSGDEFKRNLWNTVSNPRQTYEGMVSSTADFFAKPLDEQARIVGEGAVAFVATAGTEALVAKGVGVIDDLVPSANRSLRTDPAFGSTPSTASTLPELRPSIRATFLDGEAVVTVLDEPLLVQRFHGGGSSTKGAFATTDIFKSRVDVREQLALPYTWSDGAAGNAVTKVTTIELPAGTRIWSGKAASQIDGISGKVYQGGGNQIWIDAWIQDDWIKDTRWFRSDRGKN